MTKNHDVLSSPVAATAAVLPRVGGDAVEKAVKKSKLLYDLQDLSEIFCVTKRTLYNWRAQGLLPMFEIGGKAFISAHKLGQLIVAMEGGAK